MPISRELYRERKNKNLCTICGEPVQDNRSLCSNHAIRTREKQRAITQKRTEQGLCSMCGKRPSVPRRKRCQECLDIKKLDSQINRAPLIKTRIKDGLCVACGQSKVTSNKLCDKCSQKYNASARLKDQRRKNDNLCTKCGHNPPENNRRKCLVCLEIDKKWRNKPDIISEKKRKHQILKQKVMDKYGGKCNCCGTKEITFLTIDHVNGNGTEHRRQINKIGGNLFYKWLLEKDFSPDFQVLCYNCNISKYRLGGICAHKHKQDGV